MMCNGDMDVSTKTTVGTFMFAAPRGNPAVY